MSIIVDRPKLVISVLVYLNMNFGDLTPKTNSKYRNSVFYLNSNNEVMMEYDKENGHVFIHNDHVWSKIESLFHLNYNDIKSIMKVWLEESYKLEGVTPSYWYRQSFHQLEDD